MKKKKTPEELDKYLRKFAFGNQKKLVDQLRQMINPKANKSIGTDQTPDRTEIIKSPGRDDLFLMMDSIASKSAELFQYERSNNPTYLEILFRPVRFPLAAGSESVQKAFKNISIINKAYSDNTGAIYTRDITVESIHDKPNIFDPKSQAIYIAGILNNLGIFYRALGFGPNDVFDIIFRYGEANNLAVGSIGSETFMPTRPLANRYLTLYVVRPLCEIVGRTKELSADIIIELLKKLNYQGIVNKDFFIHAISKHFAINHQK